MKTRYVAFALLLLACGPASSGGPSDSAPACTDGVTRCEGNNVMICQGGTFIVEEQCPSVCSDVLGCTLCEPGTGTCDGDVSIACRSNGSGWDEVLCDPAQGVSCDINTGLCEGACAPQVLGASYIGCEYFPTVTANIVGGYFFFAVAVSNTGNGPADVTIEGGALSSAITFTVQPDGVEVQSLPWVADLKACTNAGAGECGPMPDGSRLSRLVANGAYHLRSSQPVTVYQFNPLDYTRGGGFSYSNDASLLMPSNAMGEEYLVAAYPALGAAGFPSLLAVTAARDNTQVTVTSTVTIVGGEGGTFTAGQPRTVTLNQRDVLQLFANTAPQDLTGSLVTSDKPVQVIGGHYCTYIPVNSSACDHLEESMFPVAALSRDYIINAPAMISLPDGKVQVVRILATTPNTTLTYDPPQPGAPAAISQGWVEIVGQAASYRLSANHKILVAQYMEGQTQGGNSGDPAMALAVPIDQFRTEYLFHAPTNYETNHVDIVAPMGGTVILDGVQIPSFTPIGASGWGLYRVFPLGAGPGNDGNHRIVGDMSFGISVYGYGQWTSYWYPGGLDLNLIPVE